MALCTPFTPLGGPKSTQGGGANIATFENAISSGQNINHLNSLQNAFDGDTENYYWYSKQSYKGIYDGHTYGYTGSYPNSVTSYQFAYYTSGTAYVWTSQNGGPYYQVYTLTQTPTNGDYVFIRVDSKDPVDFTSMTYRKIIGQTGWSYNQSANRIEYISGSTWTYSYTGTETQNIPQYYYFPDRNPATRDIPYTDAICSTRYPNTNYVSRVTKDSEGNVSSVTLRPNSWVANYVGPVTTTTNARYLFTQELTTSGTYTFLLLPSTKSWTWNQQAVTVSGSTITVSWPDAGQNVTLTRDSSLDQTVFVEGNPEYIVENNAYLGNINLMEKVVTINLYQYSYAADSVPSVKVQYSSDNGTSWQDLQTYDTPYSTRPNVLTLPDYTPVFPYGLRIMPTADITGSSSSTNWVGNWYVYELEFIKES